jgi:hypothetical protein
MKESRIFDKYKIHHSTFASRLIETSLYLSLSSLLVDDDDDTQFSCVQLSSSTESEEEKRD